MATLDAWLPEWDARERHERRVSADPEAALAAALEVPFAPDGIVRALFRVRGLSGGGTVVGTLRSLGFEVLAQEPDHLVLGAAGTPWNLRTRPHAFAAAREGEVRVALSLEAAPAEGGAVLATETRISASDSAARRAFLRYWRVVGPFSAVVRRHWLKAAERALT